MLMADTGANEKMKASKKTKKRKQRSQEETEGPSKAQRIELRAVENDTESEHRDSQSHEFEFLPPWKNLQLILCIQNKQLDLQRKIELAFSYVQSRIEDDDGTDQDYETIKLPRLLCLLNDWTQSLLISSDTKKLSDGQKSQVRGADMHMDLRCWEIFKFCLQESLKFNVSLNMSRHLLRPVHFIARNALSLLEDSSISSGEYFIAGERYKLYGTALDCVSLVFSSHGGLSNENLELWITTICTLLELVQKMYTKHLDRTNMGEFALHFLCLVLQPFSKFLRVHPAKKNGFHNFVDKLLEPLLHLLGKLNLQVNGSNTPWTERLLKVVEEVLSYGLFHPIHIDGFLSLHGLETYVASCDDKLKDSKAVVIKSYHRHLFDVLDKVIARKNTMAISSIGFLFHLYVNAARKFKGTSVLDEATKRMESTRDTRQPESGDNGSNNMSSNTQKSLINFLVHIMEPLLLEINKYTQAKTDAKLMLSGLHGILKCISNMLASFIQEKVYVRTEDTTGGGCLNFLKKIYNELMLCSTTLLCFSNNDVCNRIEMEMLALSVNEMVVAIGYLLEIEYEAIGEDLVNLWGTLLSFLTINGDFMDVLDRCSLPSSISGLGSQIINLYSELRQVDKAILALCKAIRLTIHHEDISEETSRFMTSVSNEVHSQSVGRLLSSQEFINAIHKAVQSIPGGSVSDYILHLTDDISKSLLWLKDCSPLVIGENCNKRNMKRTRQIFNLRVVLLGRGLSRLYSLVLESLIITEEHSKMIGGSMKKLIELMHPYLSTLVRKQRNSICNFLSNFMGNTADQAIGKRKILKKFGRSSQWVILFFFQLLVSCRSLLRQTISLLPPDLSKKMSVEVGDFIAYSARELMERIDAIDMGYFSWICQPSASLLAVMQNISDIYLEDCSTDSFPLMYTLHCMTLQRLVDLRRQIVLFKYLQNIQYNSQIKVLEEEAAGLTNFMMENLSCVYQSPFFGSDEVNSEDLTAQYPNESNGQDLGICFAHDESFPMAIWSNLCENIDIWGNHASKKQLKKFFTHLLSTSLHCVTSSFQELGPPGIDKHRMVRGVTLPQISSELLSCSVLYELKFTRRILAKRICCALEKSVLPLFSETAYSDVKLQRSPNWLEFINDLDNSVTVVDGKKDSSIDCSPVEMSVAQSCDKLPADFGKEDGASPFTSKSFAICRCLLNFLCRIPDINARSFSLYVTCIFNLERLLVNSLLNFQDRVNQDYYYELFRLFVSCRKALRYIIMGFCKKAAVDQFLPNSIFSESTSPVLWLFKSVSVILGHIEKFSAKNTTLKPLVSSLMDHTSYVLLGIGKHQIIHSLSIDEEAENPSEDMSSYRIVHEKSHLLQSSQSIACCSSFDALVPSSLSAIARVDFLKSDALKSLTFMTDSLKDQMKSLLVSPKDAHYAGSVGFGSSHENLNKLSFTVSCLSGILWGFASVMDRTYLEGSVHKEMWVWNNEHTFSVNTCLYALVEVVDFLVHKLLADKNQPSESSCSLGSKCFTLECSCAKTDASRGIQQECKAAITSSGSSAIDNDSKGAGNPDVLLEPGCENSVASILVRADSLKPECLNMPLLQSLLKGDHPEVAFLLRQLLIASAVLLKLNSQKDCSSLLSSVVPAFVEISKVLLLEFIEMAQVPQQPAFLLLDGVLSYLRELSSYFPFSDPTSTGKLYSNLIELYLRAIGKIISLQGKQATLTFHERQASAKKLYERSFEEYSSSELYCFCLNELKARLRMSFIAYIEKPSELHLLSAVQAVERALVGVREGRTMIYDINTSTDGGAISSAVAAGIDGFDMILEFVSDRKGLKLIKRHFQTLVAAVFNIILHVRSPLIFHGHSTSSVVNGPDPGSAILMCVEVLTTISRRNAQFQMDSWHIGQLLRIPAALFQNFHQLRVSKDFGSSDPLLISEEQISHRAEAVNLCYVDRQFSLNLFVACCQLLGTTIKHHHSECKHCVGHLEASVAVLLNCLESVHDKDLFSWEVEEGVTCACFLRRVYEEIKQQKDIFNRQCSLFLSNYIWVYSGFGPRRSGIRREIDEALRPGVYALIDAVIDASKRDDLQRRDYLQHLHTVFGEGPCRSTLANLKEDYDRNHKYEGKV